MTEAAPGIIHLFDRMGVMFNRTPEGLLDFRRFGGTQHHRTAFAGATTGQQLLYALDEQVRRYEVDGLVTKYEGWEFLGVVNDDDGVCRGIIAQNLQTMEIQVISMLMRLLWQQVVLELFLENQQTLLLIQVQQLLLFINKVHIMQMVNLFKFTQQQFLEMINYVLMSESARGEGGRVWTYKDGKPWYFLEEKYPAYGNLVPRDIATREIFDVCVNQKLGINGENMVYLDLSHKDPQELRY